MASRRRCARLVSVSMLVYLLIHSACRIAMKATQATNWSARFYVVHLCLFMLILCLFIYAVFLMLVRTLVYLCLFMFAFCLIYFCLCWFIYVCCLYIYVCYLYLYYSCLVLFILISTLYRHHYHIIVLYLY